MEKTTLPMIIDPPLKCYLWQLHFLGVIFSEKGSDALPWLYNHYYQISVEEEEETYLVAWSGQKPTFVEEDVFIPQSFAVLREAADPEIIFPVIRNMLKLGFYCTGNMNEKYIPGFKSYQRWDFNHAFMIYGLDEENQTVVTNGYLEDGRCSPIKIRYADFFNGLLGQTRYNKKSVFLMFYRLNPDFDYNCFDPKSFIEGVESYLSWKPGKGICAIDKWIKLIEECPIGTPIDKRNIYLFAEQKSLMAARMSYMLEHGYLTDSSLVERYKEIAEAFERLKMLILKYNLSFKPSVLKDIVDKGKEYLAEEETLLRAAYYNCANQIQHNEH